VIGLVAGIGLVIFGFRQWTIKRLIENTPTSKIRSIAMGLVEICGTVGKPLKEYLKAPFTGKDCVYYSYAIEEQRTGNKGQTYWVTLRSGEQSVPFFVKDNTASVLVESKNASLSLTSDFHQTLSLWTNISPHIKSFSEKNNLRLHGLFGNRPLRFTEINLAPNDKIYIFGTAGDNPYVKEATAASGVDDMMIQKGNKPFYISDKDEKGVLKSFAWQVYGCLFGGSTLVIVCLFYILFRIGLF
ncbi:MAG TPA: GIDE domain-containing protein, partial [Candidatus Nanoarchaeia archaeon]|nr:GIDE domain-containing protein [Candidatus Nanoarchaeia archaeon]